MKKIFAWRNAPIQQNHQYKPASYRPNLLHYQALLTCLQWLLRPPDFQLDESMNKDMCFFNFYRVNNYRNRHNTTNIKAQRERSKTDCNYLTWICFGLKKAAFLFNVFDPTFHLSARVLAYHGIFLLNKLFSRQLGCLFDNQGIFFITKVFTC